MRLLRVLPALATALALLVLAAHFLMGLSLQVVLSNSMAPSFRAGDVLVTKLVDVDRVQVGDVPVFTHPGDDAPTAHRVVERVDTDAGTAFTTRGDANPSSDPVAVLETAEVPEVVLSVPLLGHLLVHTTPASRALAIAVLGALILAHGVYAYVRGEPDPGTDPGSTDTPTSSEPEPVRA